MITIKCKKCGGTHCIKNGIVRNKQRFKCKSCGYSFVINEKREKKDEEKIIFNNVFASLNEGTRYGL